MAELGKHEVLRSQSSSNETFGFCFHKSRGSSQPMRQHLQNLPNQEFSLEVFHVNNYFQSIKVGQRT